MEITNNNTLQLTHTELSIQIGLNGLSFCILDPGTKTITHLYEEHFEKSKNPFELLDSLKHLFNTLPHLQQQFKKVTLLHDNELATLVPKALFNVDNIADYLKFNAKILQSDFIAHDPLDINDTITVYVPYVNINNFIYDTYGSFTYKHKATVFIEQLLQQHSSNDATIYVNITPQHFEIAAINNRKLLLYNTFEYTTKEDFIYYLLFTAEQLEFNPETFQLILLGAIAKDDELYNIAYTYIRNVSFGNRLDTYSYTQAPKTTYANYILLKSL